MKFILEVKDEKGNYINSTEFHILKENSNEKIEEIINWSFDHLKNDFLMKKKRDRIYAELVLDGE